jgi:hypothetical protein
MVRYGKNSEREEGGIERMTQREKKMAFKESTCSDHEEAKEAIEEVTFRYSDKRFGSAIVPIY